MVLGSGFFSPPAGEWIYIFCSVNICHCSVDFTLTLTLTIVSDFIIRVFSLKLEINYYDNQLYCAGLGYVIVEVNLKI